MKLRISNQLVLYFLLVLTGIGGFFFTVFLPHLEGLYMFIVVASMAGFGVSLNIYHTKTNNIALVCPTGSNCEAVTRSKYAKFFGISLEYFGMAYFSVMTFLYVALITTPSMFQDNALLLLMLMSLSAGLFSAYLLFVQAFILRKWCIWCILTGLLSLSIATVSLVSVESTVVFLRSFEPVLEMLKFLGFCFGVGGITAAILLFRNFLKDDKIDEKELDGIKSVSELVWVGLGLVIISYLALYVAYPSLINSGIFVFEISLLFIAAFSGAVLMIVYAPFLVYMPFGNEENSAIRLRKPSTRTLSVAALSWYFAFFINFFPNLPLKIVIVAFVLILSIIVVIVEYTNQKTVLSIKN
ncbi:MAG: hypothetical protein COV70_01445 [Parcubacteria group bacterium CG11_big_fil_rev_8_21_14_0_20_39_22]|nr:MAG: hypothetical protein COV70_01445 [Parcubacteria group bacterium CG11_big_fil_rev_8_21_14_0_20_39_22]